MEELFFDFIDQFGYFAVGALIFIENVFPPIPSEVILPLGGFFTTSTDMSLPGVIIAATVGSVLGAYILYGIGWVLNRDRLMRFFETRPMRLLGFKGDDIAKAIDWFDRRGQISGTHLPLRAHRAQPHLHPGRRGAHEHGALRPLHPRGLRGVGTRSCARSVPRRAAPGRR